MPWNIGCTPAYCVLAGPGVIDDTHGVPPVRDEHCVFHRACLQWRYE